MSMYNGKTVYAETLYDMIDDEMDRGTCKDAAYYALRMVQEMIEGLPDAGVGRTIPAPGPSPVEKRPEERELVVEKKIVATIEAEGVEDLREQLRSLLEQTYNQKFLTKLSSGETFSCGSDCADFREAES